MANNIKSKTLRVLRNESGVNQADGGTVINEIALNPTTLVKVKVVNNNKIVLIRHGSTKLNAEDHGGIDVIRGHVDVPLSDHGRKDTYALVENLHGRVDHLVTSDLSRATETAEIISRNSNISVIGITNHLRPWNLGKFQGEPTLKSMPEIEYYVRNPDKKVPAKIGDKDSKGESFNTYRDRFLNAVKRIMKENSGKTIGIVTHYRGLKLMEAWQKNGEPETNEVDIEEFLRYNKDDRPATAKEFILENRGSNYKINIELEFDERRAIV